LVFCFHLLLSYFLDPLFSRVFPVFLHFLLFRCLPVFTLFLLISSFLAPLFSRARTVSVSFVIVIHLLSCCLHCHLSCFISTSTKYSHFFVLSFPALRHWFTTLISRPLLTPVS
jgi:hypothetical protein